jgi:hypothetical protein
MGESNSNLSRSACFLTQAFNKRAKLTILQTRRCEYLESGTSAAHAKTDIVRAVPGVQGHAEGEVHTYDGTPVEQDSSRQRCGSR